MDYLRNNAHLADMHFVYGLADGNAREARRIYQERYPNRVLPAAKTFTNLHRRLAETGSFMRTRDIPGRPRTARTPELEEAVLNAIDENPGTSTRIIADALNSTQATVWRILHDQQLYPYHIQRVQALLPRDFPQRINLCRWFLEKIAENPQFLNYVLFTDEANFSQSAITNFHNNHIWSLENPHAVSERHFQCQFSLNVWGGIVGDYLIGPFFLPLRLNGETYRHFLENELPPLLDGIPLETRRHIWFMHDGAPAHFSIVARTHLNQIYPNRWIGRGVEEGNEPWPPGSPDINPLDFYLWGHLKSIVYKTPVENPEVLRNRIIDAFEAIRNRPDILTRVRDSMQRRLDACILAEGGHFEQFI